MFKIVYLCRVIIIPIIYLRVEARVREAQNKTGGQRQGFVWVNEPDLVCLVLVIGLHGEVDKHEGVGQEAQKATQHNNGPATPLREDGGEHSKQDAPHHLPHCHEDRA